MTMASSFLPTRLKASNFFESQLYQVSKLTTPFLLTDHHSRYTFQLLKKKRLGFAFGFSVKLINTHKLTQYVAPLLKNNVLTSPLKNMTLVPIATVNISVLVSSNISLQSELLRYRYSSAAMASKYTLGINWSYLDYLTPTQHVNASLTAYYSDVTVNISRFNTSLIGVGLSHTLEKRLNPLSFYWSYGVIINHTHVEYSHYNPVTLSTTSISMQNTLGISYTINRVSLALKWVYIPTSSLFGAHITFVV